jgi:hypothetical protein
MDEAADHHDDQDDANAEGGTRRQGQDQTMYGRCRKVYWVGTRIWGDWIECFHNTPSISNPRVESYSNGKTRDQYFGQFSLLNAVVARVVIRSVLLLPNAKDLGPHGARAGRCGPGRRGHTDGRIRVATLWDHRHPRQQCCDSPS